MISPLRGVRRYRPSDRQIGTSTKGSLLCRNHDLCYATFATIKTAMRSAAGTAALITERGSRCNLFLQLLFALDRLQHFRQKPVPSSRYVPLWATRSSIGSKDPIFISQKRFEQHQYGGVGISIPLIQN